ncbi:unnamed protein product [Ambrosiozyma monospora]|uniref:Unnamed protein product n=1 Tax=Ambrosiozyma monospora TaxID=43982 RepID=A0ACB5SVA8_AMBMO|nr:unnamed protein product [Ambrosiozyma monospora]
MSHGRPITGPCKTSPCHPDLILVHHHPYFKFFQQFHHIDDGTCPSIILIQDFKSIDRSISNIERFWDD